MTVTDSSAAIVNFEIAHSFREPREFMHAGSCPNWMCVAVAQPGNDRPVNDCDWLQYKAQRIWRKQQQNNKKKKRRNKNGYLLVHQ